MPKVIPKQKHTETNIPGVVCKAPKMDKGTESISCIWCYLIKEGVKKAYSGVRRLRVGGVK